MRRHCLGAAHQALQTCRHPVYPTHRLLLRPMSNAVGNPPHPTQNDQYTAVPKPVAASASATAPSSASLDSLLTVCVDGRCSRRLSWDELVLLVNADRLEALGRLDWQLSVYAESKVAMQAEYHSVTDRLRDQRLAAPCRLVDGRKRCDWTPEQRATVDPPPAGHPMRVLEDDDGLPLRACWWKNEYGYALAEDIGHHLVWTDRYLSPDSRLFQRILSEHKPSADFDTVTFINPPELRSIPALHHIHIFSRARRMQQQHREGHDAASADTNTADTASTDDKQ